MIARWFAPAALLSHLALRLFISNPSVGVDLYLYNAIVFISVITIFQAPLHNDNASLLMMAIALTAWGVGSTISSYGQFFELPEYSTLISNIFYTVFYPCVLIAIPRATGRRRKLGTLELLDSAIFGLGLTAIVTALLLGQILPKFPGSSTDAFFSLLYPVCDLILIVSVAISFVTQRINFRISLISCGVIAFAATDFLFLFLNVNGRYQFGQLTDDGWLLGIVLISFAFWKKAPKADKEIAIHPAFIALSVFMSPTLLAIIALRPGYFPTFIVLPTIATLFLAFIRMALVLKHSRNLGEEKILARTDELTGLPNRRRLIAELNTLSNTESALLLLDLNGFKPVNDQYGHEMGDLVLRQVSARFSRSLPTGAILARLGGDEFGVLVNGAYETTLEVAHALSATLSYPITIDGETITLSVAIGHVQNDGEGDLLQRADAAMYEAKRSGNSLIHSL
jgi:diguanylate cyclase (GGDEF)-like protein